MAATQTGAVSPANTFLSLACQAGLSNPNFFCAILLSTLKRKKCLSWWERNVLLVVRIESLVALRGYEGLIHSLALN